MEENKHNEVELGKRVVGQIELPTIDITPYIGKKVNVATVQEYEGNFGFYIKVTTESLATLKQKDKDGQPISLKATRIFGLQTGLNNEIGWGEKTKLGVFLRKKNLKHYKDLIGKEVITTSVTNELDEKDYLSFN